MCESRQFEFQRLTATPSRIPACTRLLLFRDLNLTLFIKSISILGMDLIIFKGGLHVIMHLMVEEYKLNVTGVA